MQVHMTIFQDDHSKEVPRIFCATIAVGRVTGLKERRNQESSQHKIGYPKCMCMFRCKDAIIAQAVLISGKKSQRIRSLFKADRPGHATASSDGCLTGLKYIFLQHL
jgi:hypothetical protein